MAMARKDWSEKQPIMRATLDLSLFLLVILGDNFFQLLRNQQLLRNHSPAARSSRTTLTML